MVNRVIKRLLALYLVLMTQVVVASDLDLTVLYHCGRPVLFIGTLENLTVEATPDDLRTHPAFAVFFNNILRQLALRNSPPLIRELRIEQLSGIKCPIGA